jgi:hypothetical protein
VDAGTLAATASRARSAGAGRPQRGRAAAGRGRGRAGGRGEPAGGYLFCDAGLPRDGATRLELLAAEDPDMAAAFRAELERGGRFPQWGDADLARWSPTRPPGRP